MKTKLVMKRGGIDHAKRDMCHRINMALAIAMRFGGTDGVHHKAWVIDQMVRMLCRNEGEYEKWIKAYGVGQDGPSTYAWDQGVRP